ncbi:hypothetical protein NEF87_004542 [Candidatus Lokiarchaeum ossiferum]|uniref:DUF835 domain-containing protein n=1 Tax=Candidatus Lokiarchaeum ossiferum TaxID=2951803 RepID=A0ABY6HXK5_9ARCH|nr:hypothetical protein NEF87_004542 [Candidatus Lokiarchaeum sp. B-35]
MAMLISKSIITSLGGYSGSNPKILKVFPSSPDLLNEDVLEICLPTGAVPNEFFLKEYQKTKILIYTFEIEKEEERNDLGSISFGIGSEVEVNNLKSMILLIFNFLRRNNILSFLILENAMPEMIDALNNEGKIQFTDSYCMDIKRELKANNIKLEKVSRKRRGGMI